MRTAKNVYPAAMRSRRDSPAVERAPRTAPSESSLRQVELVERIRWIINLRWLAFVGVATTILVARVAFESALPFGRLALTALAVPVYNLLFYLAWRRAGREGAQAAYRLSVRHADAQILCDLTVLGLLIHLSGGVETPFCFYCVYHMVVASILLTRRAAFAMATFAVAELLVIFLGEYYGLLPHYESPIGMQVPGLHRNAIFVLAATWAAATSLYVSVYLATCITVRLRRREDQVVHLSREAQRRADELRIVCNELTEAEKAKAAHTRKVAHELRSPLAAIENLLRTVTDGLHGGIPNEAREAIQRARRRARELLNVVSDLLVLATTKEAQHTAEREEIDVRAVLERVIRLLNAQAEARKISLNANTCEEAPCVHADRESLEELLTNLVANAIKYSHEGGTVGVCVSTRDSSVHIEVSDSGIGIEKADLGRIFDEFYRGKAARSHTSDGTGLGLAIVKSIVVAHGGAISVNSSPGMGTKLTVCLPLARASTPVAGGS